MPTTARTDDTQPRVRKDVARNRALLLATADGLIAERGLGITFHDLAAAAAVGVGTVYRHFADKQALLGALVEARFDTVREVLLSAEQLDDELDALRSAVLGVCELQQRDRAIWQVMMTDVEQLQAIGRIKVAPIVERIVTRAVNSGRVRNDLAVTDVPLMFWLSGTLNQLSGTNRPDLWRRYVGLMLDGIIVEPADRLRDPTGPLQASDLDGLTPG